MDKKIVLITGASTGIGLALTERFATDKHLVIATARESSMGRFKNDIISHANIILRPLDITVPNERQKLIEELNSQYGGVDILINNAGISYRGVVEDMSDADENHQMSVNFLGAMALTRLILPGMREKRRGSIINISSVSGMMAMPTMSSYSASKFALEGAMESLWYEMRPWNIRIKLIQPGFVRSDAYSKVLTPSRHTEPRTSSPYAIYYKSMEPFVAKMMERSLSTPKSVADKVFQICHRNSWKLRHAATLDARVFYLLRRLLPRNLYHFVLYMFLPHRKQWGS